MLSFEENIRAILDCNFSQTKEEIIEIALASIMKTAKATFPQSFAPGIEQEAYKLAREYDQYFKSDKHALPFTIWLKYKKKKTDEEIMLIEEVLY